MSQVILLADGQIDEREVKVLRKELFADNRIDEIEMEYLLELRHKARSVSPSFNLLVLEALKNCVLAQGTISASHAGMLRRWIFADGKVDFGEKRFLQELKAGAKQVSREFDDLYRECMGPG
jgi:hypothetical protein